MISSLAITELIDMGCLEELRARIEAYQDALSGYASGRGIELAGEGSE